MKALKIAAAATLLMTGGSAVAQSASDAQCLILSNAFASQAKDENGIVVPQQAVTRGSTGDSVMVVGADGKVAPRPVKIGSAIDGGWLVLDGLSAGARVMVDGFQKLRGNAPVKPVPWQPAASQATVVSQSAPER